MKREDEVPSGTDPGPMLKDARFPGLVFRGDPRHPTRAGRERWTAEMGADDHVKEGERKRYVFDHGFRQGSGEPRFLPAPDGMASLVDPRTAVVLSRSLTGAIALAETDAHWLYVMVVDMAELFPAHRIQWETGAEGVREKLEEGRSTEENAASWALWALAAHEYATRKVPAGQVLAAVRARRAWKGSPFLDGGRYDLVDPVLWNPDASVPRPYREWLRPRLESALASLRQGEIPPHTAGFVKSTGT